MAAEKRLFGMAEEEQRDHREAGRRGGALDTSCYENQLVFRSTERAQGDGRRPICLKILPDSPSPCEISFIEEVPTVASR
jgi:hypothetical protein